MSDNSSSHCHPFHGAIGRSPFYREEQSDARVCPVLSDNEGRSNECDATMSDDSSFGQTMPRDVNANLHPPLPTFSRPLEVVSTREERKRFLDMAVDDPKCEHLFDANSAFSLGFVFGEGNKEFASKDSNNRLTDLGCLSLNRWTHGITTVHFLFPSPHQGHLARDAKDPHHQSQFANVVAAMKEHKGNVLSFIFYDPLLNHSTNFLRVINGRDAQQRTNRIDWDNIWKCITTNSENKSSSATSRQAPGNSSDCGFCSSQCSGQKGSDTGHAMPQIKPNSTVPEVRDAFVTLTSFAENAPLHGDQAGLPLNHWIHTFFLHLPTKSTRTTRFPHHCIWLSHHLGNLVGVTTIGPPIRCLCQRLCASQLLSKVNGHLVMPSSKSPLMIVRNV
jgi:hypothetical protein